MGKLQAFSIEFENPNAVYSAGELVIGNVIVDLSDSMSMRGIRIKLLGRAKVHWSVRKGKNDQTHYRAEEVYVNETMCLFGSMGSDSNVRLEAGHHQYIFTVRLPDRLPSSFEGEHGYIRYTVEATIDKPWKFDHVTRTAFTVIGILDLNTEALEFRSPFTASNETVVQCCCWTSGTVSATVMLNKRCFVPGETVFISAEIFNRSQTNVCKTRAALKQYTEFRGVSDSFFSSGNMKSRWESSVAADVNVDQEVTAGTTGSWHNVALVIPSIPPSRLVGCNIINVNYVLKIYVDAQYSELKLSTDLLIGTIPLRGLFFTASHPVTGGAITVQPTSSANQQATDEPPDYSSCDLPPPSYEECVSGQVDIREVNDSKYLRGNLTWAPKYPMYRQLSVLAAGTSSSAEQ
jgi:hypothetical protein